MQVVLTRNTDEFIPLHERARIANRNSADLFISIHCNAISRADHVHGSETYVLGPHKLEENLAVAMRENSVVLQEENYETIYGYDPNSPEAHIIMSMYQNAYLEHSILFADRVEKHMVQSAGRHSRGVKQAGFLVLRETTMPSVLVETGFLSNRQEEDYLRSQKGQYEIAQALLAAFAEYKTEVEGSPAEPAAIPVPVATIPEPEPEPFGTNGNPAPAPTPAPTPTPRTDMPRAPYKGIVFRVQLAASAHRIDTRSGNWVHLTYPLEIVEENSMIKYQITASSGLWQADEIRKQMQQLGFKDAFVVVYQYGQRIQLEEAKRQLGIQ
jgi:N-acetylmuramoyl-L-alanine amidase